MSGLRTRLSPLRLALFGVALLALSVTVLPAMTAAKDRIELLQGADLVSRQLIEARYEALNSGFPVIVRIDTQRGAMEVFSNVDGSRDLLFHPDNPVSLERDQLLARYELPANATWTYGGVDPSKWYERSDLGSLGDPRDDSWAGHVASGFNLDGEGRRVAVFDPLGKLRTEGSIRLTSDGVNVLEIRVSRYGALEIHKLEAFAEYPARFVAGNDPYRAWNWL